MQLSVRAIALLLGVTIAAPASYNTTTPFSTFSQVTIFTPDENYTDPRVLYPRTVELDNGVLLATWENYSPEPPLVYFPIYRSADGGASWEEISRIQDTVNNYGLRYQPMLYRLPIAIGKYKAGTILCAGNSIPTDLSVTKIDVYASEDDGYNWDFVSHVAVGGRAVPDNGVPAIWEPFLLAYEGSIVLYYSDQRDTERYGQKLVHTVSEDLLTWGPDVEDVTYPVYTARPGMTTIIQLPNKQYMMTYEYGGGPTQSSSYQFPVYYRINDSPLAFLDSIGFPIISKDGIQPKGSPTITFSPTGGENGTIIVSSGSNTQVFINRALGDSNAWETVETPEKAAYTRHVRVLESDPTHLLIMGAGVLPPSTTNNVTVSVMEIPQ